MAECWSLARFAIDDVSLVSATNAGEMTRRRRDVGDDVGGVSRPDRLLMRRELDVSSGVIKAIPQD